jgi:2-polyprenyl-3-methyl-5-hydroxy-6-metoxy-1,4-benzoquinol methylase
MPKTTAAAPVADLDFGMRRLHSMEEFHEFDLSIAERPDPERISLLSNCFLFDRSLLDMPSDPFSPEYREAVLAIHSKITGRRSYNAATMELSDFDVAQAIQKPAPYQNGGQWLGNYFESYGNLFKKLEVSAGSRVIEYGCGDGEISLHLARLGCDVTVIDIEPKYIEVVRAKAKMLGVSINAIHGDFGTTDGLGDFDRAFFYQSFHHSLEHQKTVENLSRLLRPEGLIVFGTEPIIDPEGPWMNAVPYPWGPRLDGLSLLAMRRDGWMELGFQEPYFIEMLRRSGWSFEKFKSDTNGLDFNVVARRFSA